MRKFRFIKIYLVEAENESAAENIFGASSNINEFQETIAMEEVIEKPSLAEIIQHYKVGLKDTDQCLVCGRELTGGRTESPGQIRCIDCGTTYQIQGCHLKDEFLAAHNLTKQEIAQVYCDCYEYVPLLKHYWKEVHKRIPYGIYIGASPHTQDEIDSFYGWVTNNYKRYETVYDGFNWDMLKEQYLK